MRVATTFLAISPLLLAGGSFFTHRPLNPAEQAFAAEATSVSPRFPWLIAGDSAITPKPLCPMPVARVSSTRLERMPVASRDAARDETMPVARLSCVNPLQW